MRGPMRGAMAAGVMPAGAAPAGVMPAGGWLAVVLGVAALGLGVGCDSFPDEFACQTDGDCVRDRAGGVCLSPGWCAFSDPACDSDLRWDGTAGSGVAGQCVVSMPRPDAGGPGVDAAPAADGGPGFTNACGGTVVLSDAPGDPCGLCGLGTYACDGLDTLACEGEPTIEVDVTAEGSVSASTTYSGSFAAPLAVDGDLSTSWFSSGPEGVPTRFEWGGTRDECITSVSVVGNGRHSNSSFRTNFGFGQATVQVLSVDDRILFSEVVALPGTPDPDVLVHPNAYGRRVLFLLTGHESDDCGGFSEVNVVATRTP